MPLGFILHPTYYVEKGRPVVHLFGVDEAGESFVVRDDRTRPHFFIRSKDLPAALRLATFPHEEAPFTNPAGENVSRVFIPTPPEAPALRDRLQASGIPTFEADIPFVTRFLMEAGIRGSLRIEGEPSPGRRIRWIYQNPTLHSVEWTPRLRVLSLDIETDPDATRLLSIALWSDGGATGRNATEGAREVLLLWPGEPAAAERAGQMRSPEEQMEVIPCPDERTLLLRFLERVRQIDPDVLTGWNVIDFDLQVLDRLCLRHRIPFHLGRADLAARLRFDKSAWGASRALVPGRVVLDALTLLRDSFVRLEDYRLETAAQALLGRGKVLASVNRAEDILRSYEEDLPTFLRYNLNDARLVAEILDAKKLVELAVRRSLVTGMPMDRVGASIASFDFLYLSELHRRGQVGPTVEAERSLAPTQGGFVFESRPGIYENVAVLDYRSLYPSLIRTFRLDPLSLLPATDAGEEAVEAPNGARFRRQSGILPELLDRLFPLREESLRRGDGLTATALKILMNSFYGVLATSRCRFYSPETANAITGFGQKTLLWTREALEVRGTRVLYGDTDSIFAETGAGTPEEAVATGERLAEELNRALSLLIREEYGVESRLTLRFDRLFRKLLLPSLRHSSLGSKKRYVGLEGEGEAERLVFVGLESVRRDWTNLAKQFQRELVLRVFRGEPLEEFLLETLRRLRAGEMDALLVYRKALGKPEASYTVTTPPHVQAARLQTQRSGRIVRYVMTTAGPEPEEEQKHPPDYEHYAEKQLRPVAEAILSLTGLTWDGVTTRQGTLPF